MRRPAEATLDGVLRDLAKPENCTSATVAAARTLLCADTGVKPVTNAKSTAATGRARTYSRKASAAVTPRSTTTVENVVNRVDTALRVLKASLAALQQLERPASPAQPVVSGARSVHKTPAAARSTVSRSTTAATAAVGPGELVCSVANAAIEGVGAAEPDAAAVRSLAMLYCNFLSQAVDLGRAAQATASWSTVHRVVHTAPASAMSISGKGPQVCFAPDLVNDPTWTDIIVTLQLGFLRAMVSSGTTADRALSRQFLDAGGVVDNICGVTEDAAIAEQRREHLYRLLLKLEKVGDKETKLDFARALIRCRLGASAASMTELLPFFCGSLALAGINDAAEVAGDARMYVEQMEKVHDDPRPAQLPVLCERIAKLCRKFKLGDEHYWLDRLVAPAQTANGHASDVPALLLSFQARVPPIADLTARLQALDKAVSVPEAKLYDKALAGLCSVLAKSWKAEGKFSDDRLPLLSVLLDMCEAVPPIIEDTTEALSLQHFIAALSHGLPLPQWQAIVDPWLPYATLLTRLTHAIQGRSLSAAQLKPYIHNLAGTLLHARRWSESAAAFDLYLDTYAGDQENFEKVQLAWNAHLMAGQHATAMRWLEKGVFLAATGRKEELDRIITKATSTLLHIDPPRPMTFEAFADGQLRRDILIRHLDAMIASPTLRSILEVARLTCQAHTAPLTGDLLSRFIVLASESAEPRWLAELCENFDQSGASDTLSKVDRLLYGTDGEAITLVAAVLDLLEAQQVEIAGDKRLARVVDRLDQLCFTHRLDRLLLRLHELLKTINAPTLGGVDFAVHVAEAALRCDLDLVALSALKRAKAAIAQPDALLSQRVIVNALEVRVAVAFGTAGAALDTSRALIDTIATLGDARPHGELIAHALRALAVYHARFGDQAIALQLATESVSVLRYAVARSRQRRLRSAEQDGVDALTSRLQAMQLRDRSDGEVAQTMALAESYALLGTLFSKQGIVREAQHYFGEAHKLLLKPSLHSLETHILDSRFKQHAAIPIADFEERQLDLVARLPRPISVVADVVEAEIKRDNGDDHTALAQLREIVNKLTARPRSSTKSDAGTAPTKKPAGKRKNTLVAKPADSAIAGAINDGPQTKELVTYLSAELLDRTNDVDEQETLRDRLGSLVGRGAIDLHACNSLAARDFGEALRILEVDPVYGTLTDSVLSIPNIRRAIAGSASRSSNAGLHSPLTSPVKPTKGKSKADVPITAATKLLASIERQLWSSIDLSQRHSSDQLCRSSFLCCNAAILRSATTAAADTADAGLVDYLLHSAKNVTIARERCRRRHRARDVQDIVFSSDLSVVGDGGRGQRSGKDILKGLPDSWTIVSVAVDESTGSLLMSRLRKTTGAMALRLPISRHTSRDADEETFSFETAKAELKDIIASSNASAQAAKDIKDRSGKTAWWRLRKELDERLKILLSNMERCWLGGFRGIFGPSRRQAAAFDSFRTQFARILVKHVPAASARIVDFDARLLDLFIDLGPVADTDALEVIEDLLYFILDIYQFHGQSIAYDEIDVDQMTLDIQSCLASYHEKVKPNTDDHLILVLDKGVIDYPWESIPSLRGRSVSRLPSIDLLADLMSDGSDVSARTVSATSGQYVLNPSGDLSGTQATFQPLLNALSGWSGTTGQAPIEQALLDGLGTTDIFLYFGHGGAEQFVRANRVKALPRCSVAILMGCSSGQIKPQGNFDAWGTPYNYLVADSPCVVANLWDVTDKDIDRFASEMLGKWGLFDNNTKHGELNMPLGDSPRDMSTALAVNSSRDSCLLPYLNGAAPVVYGIPVWLDRA